MNILEQVIIFIDVLTIHSLSLEKTQKYQKNQKIKYDPRIER